MDRDPDSRARRVRHPRAKRIAEATVLGVLLALIAWVADRVTLGVAPFTYVLSAGFVANALPFVAIFCLLLGLAGRARRAFWLALVPLGAFYHANAVKLAHLGRPLSFNDGFVLGDLDSAALALFMPYIDVPAVLAASLALAALAWWLRGAPLGVAWHARVVLVVASSAVIACVAVGAPWLAPIYDGARLRAVPWSVGRSVLHAGAAANIVRDNIAYAGRRELPIARGAIERLLAHVAVEPAWPASTPMRPDIVIVQSESFFDPSIFRDYGDAAALLPNLDRAMTEGHVGRMRVPTFGGGTVRTEFEVLAGVPMTAFPEVHFPYVELRRTRLPSLIDALATAGYRSHAVHANHGRFWNRRRTFAAMGFDEFRALGDFPADAVRDGWHLGDAAMTDQVEAVLDAAKEPVFIFAIGIGGHGPYLHKPAADEALRRAIAVPPAWRAEARTEFRNALYDLVLADRELGRLRAFLEHRGRPFVLVFYGDHLPGFEHVYAATRGFRDGGSAETQRVPWLLVSNLAAAEPAFGDIESWMLGSIILRHAGIVPTAWYRWSARVQGMLGDGHDALDAQIARDGLEALARVHFQGGELPEPGPVGATTRDAAPAAEAR